jgi:hypothetical protein
MFSIKKTVDGTVQMFWQGLHTFVSGLSILCLRVIGTGGLGFLQTPIQASDPSNADAGTQKLYVNSLGNWSTIDSSGVKVELGAPQNVYNFASTNGTVYNYTPTGSLPPPNSVYPLFPSVATADSFVFEVVQNGEGTERPIVINPVKIDGFPSWITTRNMMNYAGNLYVSIAGSGGDQFYSYNGSSTPISITLPTSTFQVQTMGVYGQKLYVMFYDSSTTIMSAYSYDGTNWANVNLPSGMVSVRSTAVYGGSLYIGCTNISGEKVYFYNGSSWTAAGFPAYGSGLDSLAVYNGNLYAGTAGNGHVYYYNGSSWVSAYIETSSGWSDDNNWIYYLAAYNGKLYAGTGNSNNGAGQVWSYNGSSWSNTNLGWKSTTWYVNGLSVYKGKLYASGYNTASAGEIWVYDGTSWTNTNIGWPATVAGATLTVFQDTLYAGVSDSTAGSALWRFGSYTPQVYASGGVGYVNWTNSTCYPDLWRVRKIGG